MTAAEGSVHHRWQQAWAYTLRIILWCAGLIAGAQCTTSAAVAGTLAPRLQHKLAQAGFQSIRQMFIVRDFVPVTLATNPRAQTETEGGAA